MYYPKFTLGEDAPDTPFHQEQLRIYDPSGKGKRHWPTCNGHFTFSVAILTAAASYLTGEELVSITGNRVRLSGHTSFEF